MKNIGNYKKVIIKIGSSLLIKEDQINISWLKSLVDDIKHIQLNHLKKTQFIIVSSGSIALGKNLLNKKQKIKFGNLTHKQASSAIGQTALMHGYQNVFAQSDLQVAQILLTEKEANDRESYINATNTINLLCYNGIIPIINENNTIATNEIKIGDNDRLAARIAQMIHADLLILLSDVDGLYEENPRINQQAKLINLVTKIDNKIEKIAGDSSSKIGTGGMKTKIQAAKIAFNANCDVIIANGTKKNPIHNIINQSNFTFFQAQKSSTLNSKKRWIIDSINIKGEVFIDKKAQEALERGSSLLPVGVKKITGDFMIGDVISIKNTKGENIGSGVSSYCSKDLQKIIGKKTSKIQEILKDDAKDELVNRSELVLM